MDLHRHLEGALRVETLFELHQARRQRLHPSLRVLRRRLVVPPGERPGFAAFLERFNHLRFCYGGPGAIERLAREAVADAAADGVVHLELRFSPVFAARRQHDTLAPALSREHPPAPEEVEASAQAVVRAARDEAALHGISVAFIVCLNRSGGTELNRPAVELLNRPVGAALAGLDVAGDESVPLSEVGELIALGRAAGRKITLHAGEDPRGDGAARVREAAEVWGADRIGHGVRVAEHKPTAEWLRQRGVPLEICLTSNVQTRAAASFAAHPLGPLLRAGLRVTLNTDDPAISGTTLSEEYARAHEQAGLNRTELARLALNGAQAAFLPDGERRALARRIEAAWRDW